MERICIYMTEFGAVTLIESDDGVRLQTEDGLRNHIKWLFKENRSYTHVYVSPDTYLRAMTEWLSPLEPDESPCPTCGRPWPPA